MKSAYRVLAGLTCLLVLVQAGSVAFGTFGIIGQNIHSFGALAVSLVVIIRLIVSFFAKIDGGVKWAGIVFVAVVLQWVFAIIALRAPVVGILHGINAFVIFGTAMTAMQRAKASASTPVVPASV